MDEYVRSYILSNATGPNSMHPYESIYYRKQEIKHWDTEGEGSFQKRTVMVSLIRTCLYALFMKCSGGTDRVVSAVWMPSCFNSHTWNAAHFFDFHRKRQNLSRTICN